MQVEELEARPSGLKRVKRTSEESNGMTELVEALRRGLKAIMDVLDRQGRLL